MSEESLSSTSEEINESGYSKYGIKDTPRTAVTTAIGQARTVAGLSKKEWLFLTVSVVDILTALGLTLYRFIKSIEDNPESADFTFALLLLINGVFCLFYAIHGLLRERIYELYVLSLAILIVLIYCITEYAFFNVEGRTTLKLVRMILICVLAPPNIYLAFSVAQHFGYLQFRIVGASEHLQYLYKQASIFSCLLKFDVQVTASFVVLVLKDGTSITEFMQISLGIGIPFSVLWNLLGWITLRKEIKITAWIFAFTGLAKPAFYLEEIIQEYIHIRENIDRSDTITYSTIAAGMLAILIWIILMVELVLVYRNFGKGLKERAYDVLATESTSLITGRSTRH